MNKCPFGFKKHEDCGFYRKGIRVIMVGPHGKEEHVPFEECAVNILTDCAENIVTRNISLQQEMNLVRNEVAETNKILNTLLNMILNVRQIEQPK